MKITSTRLALALSLAFNAPLVLAQATANDGTSNTVLVGTAGGGSLTTSATSSASVSQRTESRATSGSGQTVAVGSALDVAISRGEVSARGVASGFVSQSRDFNSNVNTAQTLTVGSVAGALNAAQISADGTLQGRLTQTSRRGGVDANGLGQRVDIGSVSDAGGGNLVAQGRVLGEATTITQDHSGQEQLLRVGSISGSTLQNGTTSGQVAGEVSQSSSGSATRSAGLLQHIDVGSVVGAQAVTVVTNGVVDARITQTLALAAGRSQRIAVGAVRNVDAAGSVTAGGTVQGELRQTGRAEALVRVGAVEGHTPRAVTTQGSFSGGVITQTSNEAGQQSVDIAAAIGVGGQATTQGAVTSRITQTLDTNGARNAAQLVSVGSADGTRGTVTTRALLSGNVTQTSQVGFSSVQDVLVGSVLNTGALTVRTDATVTGAITQSADGVGERQRAVFGGVIGR